MKFNLLFFLLLFLGLTSLAQAPKGQPASFRSETVAIVQPILLAGHTIHQPEGTGPFPLLAGYTLELQTDFARQGKWERLADGLLVWRLSVKVEQAEGLNFYFTDFHLSAGEKLFIYNKDQTLVKGAFTEKDNGNYFVTDFIFSDEVVVELNTKRTDQKLPFVISEVGVASNGNGQRDFGDSQDCEVPVNCPEGDDWQNEKGGIARILVKEGSNLWWCTGSLINNTHNDETPYFITANHCGQSAVETDYAAWKFYFDFEASDCEKPVFEPASVRLTGAKLLARASDNTSTGSDFKLLLLTDEMPDGFFPWFNGWDRSGEVSPRGVCIHHPEGDIKMISTYSQPLVSTRYNSPIPDETGLYWMANWSDTETNQGVTEPGSSGSPLFNDAGNIVGGLTGGQASCSSPEQPDYYGKFSYSWESNGSDSSSQLKYWLDPANTGAFTLNGSDFNSTDFYASFSADVRNIKLGETVAFTNNSVGSISNYEWEFPGGEPAFYTGEIPPPIRYATAGNFDVKLTISNAEKSDLQLRKAYIQVTPNIYPNPTSGRMTISLGKENVDFEDIQVFVYDITGREINFYANASTDGMALIIDLRTQSRGLYLLRITIEGKTQIEKVIVSK